MCLQQTGRYKTIVANLKREAAFQRHITVEHFYLKAKNDKK
jgi:hypothetical protein